MNERIRELAEQCGFRSNPDVYDRNQSFDIGKFAQLIINECLNQCYNRGMNDELYVGQLRAAAYIEQHFGVRESTGWVCPKCGTDRTKAVCPLGHSASVDGRCPMVASTL
jgi:hypothetical protein